VPAGGFPSALETLLRGDCPAGSSLLACGMVGSRQGWVEVPNLD